MAPDPARRWATYLQLTADRPPHKILQEALTYVPAPGNALDLGAGALNDSRFLADKGFSVVAVDSNPSVRELGAEKGIEVVTSPFDAYEFPEDTFALVTAQYALPFNPPETFSDMFSRLTKGLRSGGIFTGQFFGLEDSWASDPHMSFFSKEQIREMLAPYAVHELRETKRQGRTAAGAEKFWHVFDAIAEKK